VDEDLRNLIDTEDTRPAIIQPGLAHYLALDGQGAPDAFPMCMRVLRQIAAEADVAEGQPVEAQWWAADGRAMTPDRMHAWRWTVLLKVPTSLGDTQLARARNRARGQASAALLDRVTLRVLDEGLAVQVLHRGSLRDKAPVLRLMRDFARQRRYELHGKYHEIYLDDPGPDASPQARTLLRWPVSRSTFKV
jgi:hypothetical protein